MPIAPVAGLIGAILYPILYYSFPPSKYNANKINYIRKAFFKTRKITRVHVIIYLIVSFLLFLISLILVFPKY
jgi:uncharacterized membrane protein YqhA